MKSNAQHQKDAITTDKKNRTDDKHLLEEDKRHFQNSEREKKADPDRPQANRDPSKK